MKLNINIIRNLIAFISVFLGVTVCYAGPWEDLLGAIKRDDTSAVSTLLLRGADPNVEVLDQGSLLFIATREKAIDVATMLLKLKQIDVNKSTKSGETPLMIAAFNGDLNLAKELVKRGAQINKPDWTPLHYAATGGNLSIVEYLVENHAYIDAESPNNTTPLMMAARHKNLTVMRWLVENGADPTYTNQEGLSAASYMKRYKEVDEEAWLLKKAKEFESKFGTRVKPKLVAQ